MCSMDNLEEKDDSPFIVNVYSPGNQVIKNQYNKFYGPVYQGGGNMGPQGYTDEQIRKTLEACVGDGKAINLKQKWAGAYWCLRWKCNYPVDPKDFCTKIASLQLNVPDKLKCDYNNIRRLCTLSFMDYDPFGSQEVKVSNMDREVYSWCREVAAKVLEELGKTYLQKG